MNQDFKHTAAQTAALEACTSVKPTGAHLTAQDLSDLKNQMEGIRRLGQAADDKLWSYVLAQRTYELWDGTPIIPEDVTDQVVILAGRMQAVMNENPVGGNLHIFVDDGNILDEHMESLEDDAETAAERLCLDTAKLMTEQDRMVAWHIQNGMPISPDQQVLFDEEAYRFSRQEALREILNLRDRVFFTGLMMDGGDIHKLFMAFDGPKEAREDRNLYAAEMSGVTFIAHSEVEPGTMILLRGEKVVGIKHYRGLE